MAPSKLKKEQQAYHLQDPANAENLLFRHTKSWTRFEDIKYLLSSGEDDTGWLLTERQKLGFNCEERQREGACLVC